MWGKGLGFRVEGLRKLQGLSEFTWRRRVVMTTSIGNFTQIACELYGH